MQFVYKKCSSKRFTAKKWQTSTGSHKKRRTGFWFVENKWTSYCNCGDQPSLTSAVPPPLLFLFWQANMSSAEKGMWLDGSQENKETRALMLARLRWSLVSLVFSTVFLLVVKNCSEVTSLGVGCEMKFNFQRWQKSLKWIERWVSVQASRCSCSITYYFQSLQFNSSWGCWQFNNLSDTCLTYCCHVMFSLRSASVRFCQKLLYSAVLFSSETGLVFTVFDWVFFFLFFFSFVVRKCCLFEKVVFFCSPSGSPSPHFLFSLIINVLSSGKRKSPEIKPVFMWTDIILTGPFL